MRLLWPCGSALFLTFAGMPVLSQAPKPVVAPSRVAPVPEIVGTAIDDRDEPLSLADLLVSAERTYPLYLATLEERAIADGRLTTAYGAFDTNLRLRGDSIPTGTYENNRFLTSVEQAFPNSGVTGFLQYRGGYGEFPTYSGGSKTADGGETRGGLTIPFLRDRAIDRRRATLQQAVIGRSAVEPNIQRQRLDLQQSAVRAYWNWIAAGERVRLSSALVEYAYTRDEQLNKLAVGKLVARIERVDNQQNVAARNAVLADAQLRLQQAAIELSLFYRNANGEALIVGPKRLPTFPKPVPVGPTTFTDGLMLAVSQRPELRRLALQRETAEVDLRLAENQTLPNVNGFIAGAQDIGQGGPRTGPSRLDRSSLEVGLELAVPVQRRDALGRVATFQALLRQIVRQEQFARDRIRAEAQSTFAAIDRAYQAYKQAEERVGLASEVAEAERQRFQGGDSDVLRVTLREQAVFDAELVRVAALADYYRALVDFQTACGISLFDRLP